MKMLLFTSVALLLMAISPAFGFLPSRQSSAFKSLLPLKATGKKDYIYHGPGNKASSSSDYIYKGPLKKTLGDSSPTLPANYLTGLSKSSAAPTNAAPTGYQAPPVTSLAVETSTMPATSLAPVIIQPAKEGISFHHAPLSYFSVHKLEPKGARKNADVGEPHESSRQLVEIGPISAGSWWCAAGGWPSPNQRSTTEMFFVLSGHGRLTDSDGKKHHFGPGDLVILPKGWSGRWDVLEDIHKVWFVHDHPKIEEKSNPIRAIITHYSNLNSNLSPPTVRAGVDHGSPTTASKMIYKVGPTQVGYWTCTPGSFPVLDIATNECFHMLEGVCFITNEDGSACRCAAGDTVVLPKGWSGHYDVIETVKQIWVVV